MEVFVKVSVIIMLVFSVLLTIFFTQVDDDSAHKGGVLVCILLAIFGVFVIVAAFKGKLPWYVIVSLFITEICFISACFSHEDTKAIASIGIISSLAMAFSTAMLFIV